MKKFKKSVFALAILTAFSTVLLSGCAEDDKPSLTDKEKDDLIKTELTFDYGDSSSGDDSLDSADPTSVNSESSSSTEEVIEVTDANGETVTEFVPVTDAAGAVVTQQVVVTDNAGQSVTDAAGQTVTTVVEATSAVVVTEKAPSGGNQTITTPESSYVANMVNFNAWWVDISKEADFTFNDYFIEVEMKINEDIPDGKYPITITDPQFSDFAASSATYPAVVNGYVYVGEDAEAQNIPTDSNFTVIAESVSGKQGDTVHLKFKILNNPGVCAMSFNFQYDKNAVTILDAYATGEFVDVSNNASF